MSKRPLQSRHRLRRQVLVEKETLLSLSVGGHSSHPSVAYLRQIYQTEESLYFVLNYTGCVRLRDVLRRLSRAGVSLSIGAARLWAAEIVAALATLRQKGVLHRDIRPENIVVSERGHLTLVDFYSALHLAPETQQWQQQNEQLREQETEKDRHLKQQLQQLQHCSTVHQREPQRVEGFSFSSSSRRSYPNCRNSKKRYQSEPSRSQGDLEIHSRRRTAVNYPYAVVPGYAAPELSVSVDSDGDSVEQHDFGCGYGTDCWSLGCLVHELLVGEPPFKNIPSTAVAQAVCGDQELSLTQQMPAAAVDFIKSLLRSKEEERLGSRDIKELLEHHFLKGVDCMALHFHPLPLDVMQYDFAFQGFGHSCRARETAAKCDRTVPVEREDNAVRAAASAADTPAALETPVTLLSSCRVSTSKPRASDAPQACLYPQSNERCIRSGGVPGIVPISPIRNCNCSRTSQQLQIPPCEVLDQGTPLAPSWSMKSGRWCLENAETHQQQELTGALSLRYDVTEEPKTVCRRAVTEAVLGWGPPLRLRPISSADYSEENTDCPGAATEETGTRRSTTIGTKDSIRKVSEAAGNILPPESQRSSGLMLSRLREADQGRLGGSFPVSQEAPPYLAKWLLKGERLHCHGVLLRMRGEKGSLISIACVGDTHKATSRGC